MIDNKLKNLLLTTGYFKDNKYLTAVNTWRVSEIELLINNYYKGAVYCSEILNRSASTIRVKANKLGLSSPKNK